MSGASFDCRVRIDLSKLESRFGDGRLAENQAEFAKRVASEMMDYVPEDQGTLKGSEPMASDYEGGVIEWDQPYAKRVHDLPQSSIRQKENPNARSHWPEAAKGERMQAWEDYAREIMEDG